MAKLFVDDKFTAMHGSFRVRRDAYGVSAYVEGTVENSFVQGVDSAHLKDALSSVTTSLQDRYLDDIVGRATNENIGLYILYHLMQHPVAGVVVTGDGHGIEIFQHDIHPNFPARLQYECARSLLYRDRVDEAIEAASKSIHLDNTFAPAYNLRGRCNRTREQWRASLPDFETAVNLDTNFGEAYRNLGNALLYLGRTDEMLPAFSRAVDIMPASALAVNNRGFAYQRLGEWEKALRDHIMATDIDPNYAEAHFDMAAALKALGSPEKAAVQIQIAKELHATGKDTYAAKLFY